MRMLIPIICLVVAPVTAIGQESGFVGEWLLWMEQGNARRPAYGTLTIEPSGDAVSVYIDGGPVNLLGLDGDRIRFDFDWTDVGDRVHLSILVGVLDDGTLTGTATEAGEARGAWRATPKAAPRSPPPAPDPVDLSGIWGAPTIISKYSFDQTEAGRAAHAAYDSTIDDPILRCVSDGLMRMSHGPFDIEIVAGRGRSPGAGGEKMIRRLALFASVPVLVVSGLLALAQESEPYQPNILVIISDDQGVVDSPEYHYDPNPPHTPVLSALANEGVIFENAWATPMCFTTRAAYLTGLHGTRNGVLTGGVPIRLEDQTIYEFLSDNEATGNYASAFIGKWHVGQDDVNGESYPVANGVPYFAGVIEGNFGSGGSYDRWNLTIDSPETETVRVVSTEYNTSKLTRLAEEWIEQQDSPWFVTLAYNAPHGPQHWPDERLHGMQERTERHFTSDMCWRGGMGAMGAGAAGVGGMGAGGAAGNEDGEECYNAMVEAMDTEVGNLLSKLEEFGQVDDTLIIFSGDNGSSEPAVIQDRQAKSTLYAGGLHVPFFASGAGVTRKGVREDRLVTITDIFATVGEIAGADFDGSIHDSLSFAGFLSSEEGIDRPYAFSDIDRNAASGWSVRDHEHMLMRLNGEDTLFEINPDNFMYKDVTATEPEILRRLQQAGERIHRGD